MRKLFLLAFVALLAASGNAKADLASALDSVRTACSDWKAQLELDGVAKAEKKVVKACEKAIKYADAYTGATDKKGLKPLTKAIASLEKAIKAADKLPVGKNLDLVPQNVLDALTAVQEGFDALIETGMSDSGSARDDLVSDKYKGKIDKLISKAESAADKATTYWSDRYGKAVKSWVKTLSTFAKSVDLAAKFKAIEIKKGIAERPYTIDGSGNIQLKPGESLTINDICWKIKGKLGGQSFSSSGCASKDDKSGTFPIVIPAGGAYNTGQWIQFPSNLPGVKFSGTYTLKTSAGDVTNKITAN